MTDTVRTGSWPAQARAGSRRPHRRDGEEKRPRGASRLIDASFGSRPATPALRVPRSARRSPHRFDRLGRRKSRSTGARTPPPSRRSQPASRRSRRTIPSRSHRRQHRAGSLIEDLGRHVRIDADRRRDHRPKADPPRAGAQRRLAVLAFAGSERSRAGDSRKRPSASPADLGAVSSAAPREPAAAARLERSAAMDEVSARRTSDKRLGCRKRPHLGLRGASETQPPQAPPSSNESASMHLNSCRQRPPDGATRWQLPCNDLTEKSAESFDGLVRWRQVSCAVSCACGAGAAVRPYPSTRAGAE